VRLPEHHYRTLTVEAEGCTVVVSVVALELPGDRFVPPDLATAAQWIEAGRLSTRRLARCRDGSPTWWRHRAVAAEAQRRTGVSLVVPPAVVR